MKSIAECITTETKHKIFREEEGKEICFHNAQYEIVCDVVAVEKCVFNKVVGGKRCDFLFLIDKQKQNYNFLKNKSSIAFYVELKGIELVAACEQLLNSIKETSNQIENFDINALVVSSRKFIPKYDNNEYYRDVKRIIRKDIQFEISPFTVNI
jgi:hypothetical protein